MAKLVLGLDMGITSVGWGIIDKDSGEIVDKGVRIFKEGTAEENAKRRDKRSSRRLKRRKQQRIIELKRLLKKEGILQDDYTPLNNVYELRCKGLKEKLTNQELVSVIINIAKKRGISYEIVEDDEAKEKENGKAKDTITKNESELKKNHLMICEQQYEILKNEGKIRGTNNVYKSDSYKKELEAILLVQELPENVSKKIIEIVFRKRDFADGPGSYDSPTIYGRFIPKENGEIEEIASLIDKMRGKCSIYPNELRAPKMSFTADLFNFLNDLNNLRIDGEEVLPEQKKEIVNNYILPNGKITPEKLCKYFGVEEENINGFRRNGEKIVITEFKGYQKILTVLKNNKVENIFNLSNITIVDDIIEALTKYKDIDKREKEIRKINSENNNIFSEEVIKGLVNITGVSEYHSLSYKAINAMLPDLWESSDNQMQILTKLNLNGEKNLHLKGRKVIPSMADEVYSPVAKRVHNETIKVINAVIKKYGELDSIVIEMARDRNSAEEKKSIEQMNKVGRMMREKAEEVIGFNADKIIRSTPQLVTKVRLYNEQDGRCLYSGQKIDLDLLIRDPSAYEIDHIVPLSISLDNSLNNRVLVLKSENQAKGQRTPHQYFASGYAKGWTEDEYTAYVIELNKNGKITWNKLMNLLRKDDITKIDVRKNFIERNLVDTRYASRVVLNLLKNYFKENNMQTKVFTIRGRITSLFRQSRKLNKSRDNYYHHIVDALIIAYSRKFNYINELMQFGFKYTEKINEETGEITYVNDFTLFSDKDDNFTGKLKELCELTTYNDDIKISHKVDKKPNRQFTDETIYSAKKINDEYWRISKYKDIYGEDGAKFADTIKDSKNWNKFPMYKVDPETFNLLVKIATNTIYTSKQSPFKIYCEENGLDYIRKKSKDGNGPIIKSIRYYQEKLGNHLNISQKYKNLPNDKKVVLLQVTPFRTDFYIDKNGLYKFLTITFADVEPYKNGYHITDEKYRELKEKKKINDDDKFLFSLYRNDYLEITKTDEGTARYRFVATNADAINRIEVKPIYCEKDPNKAQMMLTIGKKISNISKIETDVLGNKMIKNRDKHLHLYF